jgi:hypothetical protein
MSDIKNPISKDPYSKVSSPTPIAPIEKDKKKKNDCDENNFTQDDTENTKSFIYGTLLCFINEILKISPKKSEISKGINNNTLKKTCYDLIELFAKLTKHDYSHDPKYSHELSTNWQQLSKIKHEMSQIDSNSTTTKKLNAFCESVLAYPDSEEFSLGYYLNEGSGETWTPFPLMKTLEKLHMLSQEKPRSSPLNDWVSYLHDIINTISSDIE